MRRAPLATTTKMSAPAMRSGAAEPVAQHFIERGLLERAGDRLRVSKAGRLLADGIITDLLVAEEA